MRRTWIVMLLMLATLTVLAGEWVGRYSGIFCDGLGARLSASANELTPAETWPQVAEKKDAA